MQNTLLDLDQADGLRRLLQPINNAPITPQFIQTVSPQTGIGHSLVTYNLALALADLGLRVLLIDQHQGQLMQQLGLNETLTLEHLIVEMAAFHHTAFKVHNNLALMSWGAATGTLLFHQQTLAQYSHLMRMPDFQPHIILIHGRSDRSEEWCVLPNNTLQVVVSAPHTETIKQTYAFLKRTQHDAEQMSRMLLVNQVQHIQEADRIYCSIADTLQRFAAQPIDYLGSVLYTPECQQHYDPLTGLFASRVFYQQVRQFKYLARSLVQRTHATPTQSSPSIMTKPVLSSMNTKHHAASTPSIPSAANPVLNPVNSRRFIKRSEPRSSMMIPRTDVMNQRLIHARSVFAMT
jgi:MinD-like ATPase involved in chromosome partitioning or flagellar assembly